MISLKNISKHYGEKTIFYEFMIIIQKGEMVAITGEAGCGKTTLLNIIGLIEKADEGTVDIFEYKNIETNTKKAKKVMRNTIGYLTQNFELDENETIEKTLKKGLKYSLVNFNSKEAIKNVLEKVGLSGYEKRKIHELSVEEQQRVVIAKIILKPSKLILADEPTKYLDIKNHNMVLELLKQLNKEGKTIIIASNDQYVVDQCNRVIHI